MKQEVRNKLALLLFCLLFALGGAVLVLYVYLGHNWNYTATDIDVASGSMEEYLVIMFDGTTDPLLVASQKASDEGLSGFKDAEIDLGSNDLNFILAGSIANKYGVDLTKEKSFEDLSVLQVLMKQVAEANRSERDLGQAYASYNKKNASVLPIYTKDPGVFTEGTVYVKGSYKIGVLGLEQPIETKELQARVDNLRNAGVDIVVLIGPYENIFLGTEGIDVMIVTQGSTGEVESHWNGDTFVVETSLVGTIDAVVVSPNHVMSARRI